MRYRFTGIGCVSLEVHLANVAHAWSLNPKRVTKWGSGPLAIVGSGPSLNIDKLKGYSEVWGINQTARYLNEQGIPAVFYTVDPQYQPTEGIERAVVASCLHPQIFAELAGKDVSVFPMSPDEGEGWAALAGATSACRVPLVALRAGFTRIDFYGCEGSVDAPFEGNPFVEAEKMIIRANGRYYITVPELLMQCEALAETITEFPDFARDCSGGLLGAMLADPDWQTVAFTPEMAEALSIDPAPLADFTLEASNGDCA